MGRVLDLQVTSELALCSSGFFDRFYLDADETGALSSGVCDSEGSSGHRVQSAMRVVEEFERLVSGVRQGRHDLEVLNIGDRCISC